MKSHLRSRNRGKSLSTVPPARMSADYNAEMAKAAASILYRSPILSPLGHVIYILNAAALPDANEVNYDALLPYVLSRLPGEDELVSGTEYEVIFFAGSGAESATSGKKGRPGWGWFFQAYHVLSRAMRKRIQKLYIVHERMWVRILAEMFSTVVSPKFRRKIVHAANLSILASHIPMEDLLIPPSAFLQDRRISTDINPEDIAGQRAFGAKHPLPRNYNGKSRLPRVLRETSQFLLLPQNVDTEGVFRIPAQVKLKEVLKDLYIRGQKFIIWREQDIFLPLPPYDGAVSAEEVVSEVDQTEAYGVHYAAGLIKQWYADLRNPLVPQRAYKELNKIFGNEAASPTVEQLKDLFAPKSEWSPLPTTSRRIATRHLLPLLAEVASHCETNKMTAENLAVCFAPTLVNGPDQLEDIKISSLLRRILPAAINEWSSIREAAGIDAEAFAKDLQHPLRMEDYEDPLEGVTQYPPAESDSSAANLQSHIGTVKEQSLIQQTSGVLTSDAPSAPPLPSRTETNPDEKTAEETPPALPPRETVARDISEKPLQDTTEMPPPPLPPRAQNSGSSTRTPSEDAGVRRKPAPPLSVPPRYSTVINNSPLDVTESPSTYITPADGFGPPRRGDWSFDQSERGESPARTVSGGSQGLLRRTSVRRKPITPSTSKDEQDPFDSLQKI